MNYFFLCCFIFIGIFGIRSLYELHRFDSYCKKHHPGKRSGFWILGTFTLIRALFKEHGVDDPEFTRLKNKAKWAYIALLIVFCVGVLVGIVAGIFRLK